MELKTYFAQDAAGNIISSAIVKVFLQGTTTLATGLTRADGSPLENPFAADGAGRIQFRAPDGYYDVQVSAGPGIIQTLTIQCVDYAEAKANADRAEAAADRADVSAEQVADAVALRGDLAAPGGSGLITDLPKPITWTGFSGGAAWDGVTNDNLPYRAAAQSGRKFLMPYGKGNITDFSVSLYAPNFDVLGEAEQIGSLQNPVDDFRPSRTDTKYSKYHETDPASNRWDSTYVSMLIKCPQSGVNPKGNAAALTGYVKAINSEGGDHVGVHGRAEGDTSYDFGTGMGIWGGWLSAVYKPNAASSGKLMKSIIGCEIDVQNDGPNAQRPNPQGIGEMRGLAVGNTGASHLNQAIDVFSKNSGERGRWWTGLHIRTNSIVNRSQVTTEEEVGEAVMLAGGVSSSTRYGGLKFSKYPYVNAGQGGWFSYGVDFREASFRLQNAIIMGPQHRITWEPETAKGISIETVGSNTLTIRGYNIAINNSQVLTQRQTGIFNLTGTPDGSAKNTETITLIELARYVKRMSDALIFHGLIGPT